MAGSDAQPSFGPAEFGRYQRGEMSAREQYLLEKHMLEDPMTAEAYEGFLAMQQAGVSVGSAGEELRSRLADRVHTQSRKWLYYGVAACIALVAGTTWIVYQDRVPGITDKQPAAAISIPSSMQPDTTMPLSAPVAASAGSARAIHRPARVLKSAAGQAPAKQADTFYADVASAQTPKPSKENMIAPLPAAPPTVTIPASPFSSKVAQARDSMIRYNRVASGNFAGEHQVLFDSRPAVARNPVSAARPVADKHPVPAAGWPAYNQYLYVSTRNAARKGVVTVTFTVDPAGALSGFYTLGEEALFAAATDIIRKGPVWTAGVVNGKPAGQPVTITLHFEKE
ncbi:hypothetical protein [Dyadobacter sandarakinus]|uniref:TonB C-terminal domain-containing protein n=1 Tax=Dyadobacter sandarakinus TaxID=2747268 RepID=A0ABX7I0K6_9BACT|nr:hypothetical protein [Dyadobacter sandarakinus]QRQ99560.1 hypothetical protein HWI92_00840 [Dyadobacter sandarakinus]